MRAYDWFRSVAASLNDDAPNAPFKRYALSDLLHYFNDAMCLIAKYRPDLFQEITNVKLQCGELQDVRACCTTIIEVVGQADANGNLVKHIQANKKTDTKVRSKWTKPSCLSKGLTDPVSGAPLAFVLDGVSIDTALNGRFTVSPAVPPDADVYLMLQCVQQPARLTEASVLGGTELCEDCGYLAIARFYVLGWALTGDRHSEAATAEAVRAFQMFLSLLGIAEKQEVIYERAAT